jgi:shikimate dehydrogenase/3-dehydroquinate dehydratase type I
VTPRDIPDARAAIRKIDRQLLGLLQDRARLALEVGEAKQQQDLPITDPVQEEAVLAGLREHADGPIPVSALRTIYREIMNACASVQLPARGRICVSVAPPTMAEAVDLLDHAEAESDLVELRTDGLHHVDLATLLDGRRAHFVVTDRTPREGGQSPRSDTERVALLADAVRLGARYVDLELRTDPSLIDSLRAVIREHGGRTSLILSWHDTQGTPPSSKLTATLHEAKRMGADIAKIVTTAVDEDDVTRVLALYPLAEKHKQPLTSFCMGAPGRESRIEALRRGAVIGYASLDTTASTAPGQWTAQQLRRRLTHEPQRYAVFGRPVVQSLSPVMFNAAFSALGLPAYYEAVEVATAEEVVGMLRAGDFAGASVTMPFKTSLVSLLDEVDATAAAIGAVNTVTVEAGRLCGTNTDTIGLAACVREHATIAGSVVAVLGSGGAARAAVHAIGKEGGRTVVLCRNPLQATGFACPVRSLTDLPTVGATGLVNTTPLVTESPVAPASLAGLRWVMDMVYIPRRTQLLVDAKEAGCITITGSGMLVQQGAAQFRRWFGRSAPTALMAAVVEAALAWRSP